ncbi:SPOR domain-containing protein [Vitreoscilla massiliensis]|uniref:SPOR domain-containing protein n=1 Tax=Vitreoscilla massiliensis TaxID=1689272 RepID=A0ABY4E304_9NEIS|nr:SPOR domain-containing protein [Vitreoscilla massiliensis]UOO90159.1 SPOR domain-containing protein [Vitreoscilla massiliensis]
MKFRHIATVLSVVCVGLWQTQAHAAVVNNSADANQPKPAKPASAKRYVVQLGAFADEFQALRWRQQWTEAGVKTYVVPAKGDTGLMRIRTGPFNTKQEAQAMVLQLKLIGVENAIVLPE